MNLTEIILLVTIALILGLFWQIHQLKENRAQEDQIGLLKENLQELRTRIDLLIDANRLSGVDLKNDLIYTFVSNREKDEFGVDSSGYYVLDSSVGVDQIMNTVVIKHNI